jgi:hypothetical protein
MYVWRREAVKFATTCTKCCVPSYHLAGYHSTPKLKEHFLAICSILHYLICNIYNLLYIVIHSKIRNVMSFLKEKIILCSSKYTVV